MDKNYPARVSCARGCSSFAPAWLWFVPGWVSRAPARSSWAPGRFWRVPGVGLVCPVVGFEGSGGRLVGSVAAFVCSGGGLGLSGALFLFPAEHQLNTHNIEPIESNQFNEHK